MKKGPGPFLTFYINSPKIPINPKNIKIILDKISIVEAEIFVPNHFPKNIAIELLATIPQVEPQISGTLNNGYCKPRPIEAKKVLSPSSPIAILEATINIQFLVKEPKNFIMRDLEFTSVFSLTEVDFLHFIKPVIPKNKKVKYVKIFK